MNYANGVYNLHDCPITDYQSGKPDTYIDHAVVFAGYNLIEKTFLLKNTWGITWGMEGYAKIGFNLD